jgi:hypothetical protein
LNEMNINIVTSRVRKLTEGHEQHETRQSHHPRGAGIKHPRSPDDEAIPDYHLAEVQEEQT